MFKFSFQVKKITEMLNRHLLLKVLSFEEVLRSKHTKIIINIIIYVIIITTTSTPSHQR